MVGLEPNYQKCRRKVKIVFDAKPVNLFAERRASAICQNRIVPTHCNNFSLTAFHYIPKILLLLLFTTRRRISCKRKMGLAPPHSNQTSPKESTGGACPISPRHFSALSKLHRVQPRNKTILKVTVDTDQANTIHLEIYSLHSKAPPKLKTQIATSNRFKRKMGLAPPHSNQTSPKESTGGACPISPRPTNPKVQKLT